MASYANSIHGCRTVLGSDGKQYAIDKQLRKSITNARYMVYVSKISWSGFFHNCVSTSVHVYSSALKNTSHPCTIIKMASNSLQSSSIFFAWAICVLWLQRILNPALKLLWITSSNAVAFMQAVIVHVVSPHLNINTGFLVCVHPLLSGIQEKPYSREL